MSKGYDRLKERIGRVEKILGIRHKDPTEPATECTCLKTGEQPLECPVHPRDRFGMGIVSDPEPDRTISYPLATHADPSSDCLCLWLRKVAQINQKEPVVIANNCPEHGHTKWKELIRDGVNFKPKCTCPPLHARVAKALGYKVWKKTSFEIRELGWVYDPGNLKEGEIYPFVPHYDLDVKLAMQALEDFNKKYRGLSISIGLEPYGDKFSYCVSICGDDVHGKHLNTYQSNESLSEAICLAIDKHAEGK